MEQISRQFPPGDVTINGNYLTLYDRYGSMAYGVILKIIPDPELAQAVLIDVFSSPQLQSQTTVSSHTAGEVIRLARAKALAANTTSIDSFQSIHVADGKDTIGLAKLVFDLAFCHGHSLEAIAGKLQIPSVNVLKFIHTYFKHLRSS